VGRDEETGFQVEQRNWDEGSGECREIVLDFESLIQGLLGVYLRYGLHTRAVTGYRDTLSEGFSHFVTSIAAPVASGWSVSPGGACTHWKAPPNHGAHQQLTSPAANEAAASRLSPTGVR
jgi:hypothetical protein